MSWPLRSIRRYGIDTDSKVFTFESGRRCPTGPGVYVFRCSRSQQLFERVQSYVRQNSGSGSADLVTTTRRSSTGQIIENFGGDTGSEPPISPRNPDAPALQVALTGQNGNQYINVNVPVAAAAGSNIIVPQTGTGTADPAPLQPQQQNPPQTQFSATDSPVLTLLPPPQPLPPNYENLILGCTGSGGAPGSSSVIMPSGTPGSCPHSPMGAGIENVFTNTSEEFEVPIPAIPQIDYAVLELPECAETNNNLDPNRFVNAEHHHGDQTGSEQTGNGKDVTSEAAGGPTSSTSSTRPPDYALIDFDRTNALGQAVNTQQRDRQMSECGQEMGIRKTRHNSTLDSICSALQTSN